MPPPFDGPGSVWQAVAVTCPLCDSRRARRTCPALQRDICPSAAAPSDSPRSSAPPAVPGWPRLAPIRRRRCCASASVTGGSWPRSSHRSASGPTRRSRCSRTSSGATSEGHPGAPRRRRPRCGSRPGGHLRDDSPRHHLRAPGGLPAGAAAAGGVACRRGGHRAPGRSWEGAPGDGRRRRGSAARGVGGPGSWTRLGPTDTGYLDLIGRMSQDAPDGPPRPAAAPDTPQASRLILPERPLRRESREPGSGAGCARIRGLSTARAAGQGGVRFGTDVPVEARK